MAIAIDADCFIYNKPVYQYVSKCCKAVDRLVDRRSVSRGGIDRRSEDRKYLFSENNMCPLCDKKSKYIWELE